MIVEDGGLDNDLGTADDNATVQQMFQITVLDVIADAVLNHFGKGQ